MKTGPDDSQADDGIAKGISIMFIVYTIVVGFLLYLTYLADGWGETIVIFILSLIPYIALGYILLATIKSSHKEKNNG